MSLACTSRTWEHSKQGATDLLILLALADHGDDDGFCWPGIDTLAAKGRISRRQTFRVVHNLADAGELIILPRTGPRSNCYIVAIGNSRSGIERSLIRAAKMGVDKKVLEPIRDALARIVGDNLSPLFDTIGRGDTEGIDTTGRGDIDVTRGVTPVSPDPSSEPSDQTDPPESADDGASEGEPDTFRVRFGLDITDPTASGDDAAWLAESRLAETDPESESEMTPEEKAEMAAPGASADLQPVPPPDEPAWVDKWRNTLRVRYQHGFNLEHVIAWVERFSDPEHANLTPPMTKGDIADWHGGAIAFLNRCHEDYVANLDGWKASAELSLRRAVWCLDYFYWRGGEGHDYFQHEVTRPGSLSNRTVAVLARDLRELQEKFILDPDDLPTVHHMKQAFNRRGTKRGKRGSRSPEDEAERAARQRRYDGGLPDELQTANVLARAAEQRAAAADQKRSQGDTEKLPDLQGDGGAEAGSPDPA